MQTCTIGGETTNNKKTVTSTGSMLGKIISQVNDTVEKVNNTVKSVAEAVKVAKKKKTLNDAQRLSEEAWNAANLSVEEQKSQSFNET